MDTALFEGTLVESERILYTPSTFARTNLIHLQECGRLKALSPHTSHRENLASYLCFIVLEGSGTLEYDQKHYTLSAAVEHLPEKCHRQVAAKGVRPCAEAGLLEQQGSDETHGRAHDADDHQGNRGGLLKYTA